MAKDEFIGIRVSKEFKKFIQREAKRKGMSLAEYIESHSEDNFRNTKKHIENLVERAREDRPEFWVEAEKSQVMKEIERLIPEFVSDVLHPLGQDPRHHPILMLSFLPRLMKSTIVNMDSIAPEHKMEAADDFLSAGTILAENLNKLKSEDPKEQAYLISGMKNVIESFAFFFTSAAFAKDSFVKIKEELDKTEKVLLRDVGKK